jgi:hypothetical protein
MKQWAAQKKARAKTARAAIKRYDETRSRSDRNAALDAIELCLFRDESSESRLSVLLSLTELAPAEIFWPALTKFWGACDATWDHQTKLLHAIQNAGKPGRQFLSKAQRTFFDELPSQVQVFRGCSRPRVRAVAWTADREVAEGFARGHRGIPVPEPVIASAIISKEHIFFVTNDRKEREVILNPRELHELVLKPFP